MRWLHSFVDGQKKGVISGQHGVFQPPGQKKPPFSGQHSFSCKSIHKNLKKFSTALLQYLVNRNEKASQNEMLNFCPLCVAEVYALRSYAMRAGTSHYPLHRPTTTYYLCHKDMQFFCIYKLHACLMTDLTFLGFYALG